MSNHLETSVTKKPPHILVVEDHPPTADIVSMVLREVHPDITVDIVRDGSECLRVLRGEDDSVAKPDIVLLDINLPKVSGLTVLETLADDPPTGPPLVIIASGQNDLETVHRCYDLGANTFIAKPDDLDGYIDLIECILEYWFVHAELPSQHISD